MRRRTESIIHYAGSREGAECIRNVTVAGLRENDKCPLKPPLCLDSGAGAEEAKAKLAVRARMGDRNWEEKTV